MQFVSLGIFWLGGGTKVRYLLGKLSWTCLGQPQLDLFGGETKLDIFGAQPGWTFLGQTQLDIFGAN